MPTSDKSASYGKGGLYRRYVYQTDDKGNKVFDRRGNPLVSYEYWQATFEIPAEDLPDGIKRRRITGNGSSQSAARRALRENIDAFYERKRNGEAAYRTPRKRGVKRRTVDDLFTDWIAHKTDEDVSSTVLRKYRRMYEQHIKPHIGSEFLDKISTRQLLQLLNSTLPSKKKLDRSGRPIAGTTLLGDAARLNIWKVLRMCFLWGQHSDYFAGRSNPMLLVKQPKVTKRLIDIDARVEDVDRIMDWVQKNRPDLLGVLGTALLGLRQSERLGLRVDDVLGINTKTPKLLVRGQLARFETDEIERNGDGRRWYWKDRTKTGVAREIPLTEPFLSYLREHLKRREVNSRRPDYKQWGDDPIGRLLFLTENGNVLTRAGDQAIWKFVCESAGVVPFPQHINRFVTAAKLAALEPAVPGNVVRAILGHESEAIGYYYQKVTSGNSTNAMERYGQTYRKGQKRKGS